MEKNHQCPDPFADKVKCNECKLWVDKSDASKVRHLGLFGEVVEWYCPTHKKPYTSYIVAMPSNLYYGEVRMEADGTPIGYKKIVQKKSTLFLLLFGHI